jgi:hypothetical protein
LVFSKFFCIFKTEQGKSGGNIGAFGDGLPEMGVNIGIAIAIFYELEVG